MRRGERGEYRFCPLVAVPLVPADAREELARHAIAEVRGDCAADFAAGERTGDRPAGPSPVLPPVEPVCTPCRGGGADSLRCGVLPAGFTTALCELPAIEAVHTAIPRSCLLANQREDSPGGPEALPVKNANLVPDPAPQTCRLRRVSVPDVWSPSHGGEPLSICLHFARRERRDSRMRFNPRTGAWHAI